MKIIVGLGNPGKKYLKNRHNVGFMFVDYLMGSLKFKVQSLKFKPASPAGGSNLKLKAQITEGELDQGKIILLKPQTFMNESGKAVSAVLNYYKIDIKDLLVVHDDLDLRLGEYKLQLGKGPKLHNGISSIEEKLGTKNFWRLRIGVDNRNTDNRIPGEAYVLQNFSLDEEEKLKEVFSKIKI